LEDSKPISPAQGARAGAAAGCTAWIVYGLVECWLFSIAPAALRPPWAYNPVHPAFTLLLFPFYAVLGAISGAAIGAAFAAAGARPRAVGIVSLCVLFDLGLVQVLAAGSESPFAFRQSSVHLLLPLAASVAVAGTALALERHGPATGPLRFLAGPAAASALLVGLPWTGVNLLATRTPGAKIAGVAAVPFVVAGAALALGAILPRRRWSGGRRALALAAFTALTLVAATSRKSAVRETPPPAETASGGVAPADAGPGGAAAARPDVILIVLDTVRADHLSVYGYERDNTPRLRELATHAVRYRRAIAAGDMTLSTHGSIFTGLYARQHGAHRSEAVPTGRPLSGKFDTLAERLARAGYWTGAVVSNTAYLSHAFGFNQGFRSYDVRNPVRLLAGTPVYSPRKWLREFLSAFAPRSVREHRYRGADVINDEIFGMLDRIAGTEPPFFLFVNYMDAHVPVNPPPPFDTMYPGRDDGFTTDDYYALLRAMVKGEREVTGAERAHLVSQYDGAIAWLDSQVGRFLDELRARGLYDDALVIVTSDHGEAFGDRALLNHGVSVYQDQVGVPLLVKYPGQTEGSVDDRLASSVDLLPTVLDVAGLGRDEGLAGASLRGPAPDGPRTVAAESFPFLFELNPEFKRTERAVFRGSLKLVASTSGKRELYDLSTDGGETRDLSAEQDSLARDLEARLEGWLEATVSQADSGEVVMDGATRARLEALGYLQ
jgi:arylsulfatase A-like enzyme